MIPLQLRKLKIDKKSQPTPMGDGNEFYPNGIFEFNVTKLLTFIKNNPHLFQPEEISVKTISKFVSSNLNESTIQVANIAAPIILAEIYPGRFNIIDGNHRLEKAYRNRDSKIFAYKIHPKEHVAF